MFMKQIVLPILLIACLPLILKLLIRLRLGFALLYVIAANTFLLTWAIENAPLSDGIFYAIVGCTALSWVVTLGRKAMALLDDVRLQRGHEQFLSAQIRKARQDGIATEDISVITVNGLPITHHK